MTFQEPVSLPVAHLPAATSFYLSALQPLGYQYISDIQNPNGTVSQAIGLGPENGSRIDLFLSQSPRLDNNSRPRGNSKRAHVVFPAPSPAAVRGFYESALAAGGRPVRAPDHPEGGEGLFTATVTDIDGNKVEVCYSGAFSPETSPGSGTAPWSDRNKQLELASGETAEDLAASSLVSEGRRVMPSRSRGRSSVSRPAFPATTAMYSAGPAAPSERRSPTDTRSRAVSGAAGSTSSPPKTIDMSSKAAVGTLIGTAATAAIAYVVLQSEEDSRRKEAEHNKRIQARDAAKAEARASQSSQEMPSRQSPPRAPQRSTTDRDSGYYSSVSRKEESPGRWRSVTYPQQSVRRSGREYTVHKYVEPVGISRTATAPAEARYDDSRQTSKSVASNANTNSTIKAPRAPSPPSQPSRPAREPSGTATRTVKYVERREAQPATQSKRSRIDVWAESAAAAPPPPRQVMPSRRELEEDEEATTVMPDDSISCIGSSPPPSRPSVRKPVRGVRDGRRRSIVVG